MDNNIWQKFSQQVDPMTAGLSLLASNTGRQPVAANLGAALLQGRQSRIDQALQQAQAAAAKRSEAMGMAKAGIKEVAPGRFEKIPEPGKNYQVVGDKVYSVTQDEQGRQMIGQEMFPKEQAPDLNKPIMDTVMLDGKPTRVALDWQGNIIAKVGEAPGKGGSATANKALASTAKTIPGIASLHEVLSDPQRLGAILGPMDAASQAAKRALGIGDQETADFGVLKRAGIQGVLENLKDVGGNDTEREAKKVAEGIPNMSAGEADWLQWYNDKFIPLLQTYSRESGIELDPSLTTPFDIKQEVARRRQGGRSAQKPANTNPFAGMSDDDFLREVNQ